jgi:hypothetical protein
MSFIIIFSFVQIINHLLLEIDFSFFFFSIEFQSITNWFQSILYILSVIWITKEYFSVNMSPVIDWYFIQEFELNIKLRNYPEYYVLCHQMQDKHSYVLVRIFHNINHLEMKLDRWIMDFVDHHRLVTLRLVFCYHWQEPIEVLVD